MFSVLSYKTEPVSTQDIYSQKSQLTIYPKMVKGVRTEVESLGETRQLPFLTIVDDLTNPLRHSTTLGPEDRLTLVH